jgi:hypothetical protein
MEGECSMLMEDKLPFGNTKRRRKSLTEFLAAPFRTTEVEKVTTNFQRETPSTKKTKRSKLKRFLPFIFDKKKKDKNGTQILSKSKSNKTHRSELHNQQGFYAKHDTFLEEEEEEYESDSESEEEIDDTEDGINQGCNIARDAIVEACFAGNLKQEKLPNFPAFSSNSIRI